MALTREQIITVINDGGSVLIGDQLFSSEDDVPIQDDIDVLLSENTPTDLKAAKRTRINDFSEKYD